MRSGFLLQGRGGAEYWSKLLTEGPRPFGVRIVAVEFYVSDHPVVPPAPWNVPGTVFTSPLSGMLDGFDASKSDRRRGSGLQLQLAGEPVGAPEMLRRAKQL